MTSGTLATYVFHIEYDIDGYTKDADHNDGDCRLTVENKTKGRQLFAQSNAFTYAPKTSRIFKFTAAAQGDEDFQNDTIEWCLKDMSVDTDGFFTVSWGAQLESDHEHTGEPGIITEFPENPDANSDDELLPQNCDLYINGNLVKQDFASGAFQTVIDISDEMNPGEWNIYEVDSDRLGEVQAIPYLEGYRYVGATDP